MGIDLYLLPFDCDEKEFCFSHTVLNCERERALFDKVFLLSEKIGEVIPVDFSGFVASNAIGTHYGVMKEDPYGDPIKFVKANKLIEVWEAEYNKNKAILAYLKCLPNNPKIALYWH